MRKTARIFLLICLSQLQLYGSIFSMIIDWWYILGACYYSIHVFMKKGLETKVLLLSKQSGNRKDNLRNLIILQILRLSFNLFLTWVLNRISRLTYDVFCRLPGNSFKYIYRDAEIYRYGEEMMAKHTPEALSLK